MIVLGIETSCDETSVALVEDGRYVLSNIVASQMLEHARYGGVVPEVASRRHVEQINIVLQAALDEAGKTLQDIDAIAVTNRPGLLGALLVGVSAAKSLAMALNVPIIGVHHIEAHLYANFLQPLTPGPSPASGMRGVSLPSTPPSYPLAGEGGRGGEGLLPDFPAVALVVSGGHTDLFHLKAPGDYVLLGRTRDDAAGEAFDKCARLMGLEYPGGPAIQKAAKDGDPKVVPLPRALLPGTFEFSFSGLKTAVRNALLKDPKPKVADVAASFQEAVVDVLVAKTVRAAKEVGVPRVFMAGGVAANARLREQMQNACDRAGLTLFYPPPVLCTDNAAMIAVTGYYHLKAGRADDLTLTTLASEPLATVL